MQIQEDNNADKAMLDELRMSAEILLARLQGEDYRGASEVIRSLVEARDRSIYNEVGRLTRGLHDALSDFHIDTHIAEKDVNNLPVELTDASHRLSYVIEMMRSAADKTMDSIDAVSPIVEQFSREAALLRNDWERLAKRELSASDFRDLYKRVDDFLVVSTRNGGEFSAHLQEILLAQSYQDLTGQIIQRVIAMVQDVERNLVDLVRKASYIEQLTGIVTEPVTGKSAGLSAAIAAEGPQVHAHKLDNVVQSQDDVDDLLSSLGF